MKKLKLTVLEREVLKWLLAGNDPVIMALRNQLNEVSVIRREYTGNGFYLYFETPSNIIGIHREVPIKADFNFGDVEATIPSLENGAGFLLWIKNGIISFLEGYTYDETWPEEIEEFKLRYHSGSNRDWSRLQKQWELGL